jgi:hypothetical protein
MLEHMHDNNGSAGSLGDHKDFSRPLRASAPALLCELADA